MSDKIGRIIAKMDECGVKFVRLQFVDIHGKPKNMAIPLVRPDQIEDIIKDGLLFDGSSVEGVRGYKRKRPRAKTRTRNILNTTMETRRKRRLQIHMRRILARWKTIRRRSEIRPKKTLSKYEDSGYEYNVGPEPEFFILDYDDEGNITPLDTGTYFDVEPIDQGTDFRRKLVMDLEALGFDIEVSHHEVAPGQHEIDFKFDNALKTADAVITFKQAIKAIVDKMGYLVTFMPKPFFGENGSGMHCHQSLFKD
jgi:L-glutamine synthetase (EC 6.3.1.2)